MADPNPTQTPPAAFANVARIRHTQNEFYVDFGQVSLDHAGVATLVSLIVMTPQHAKLLLNSLGENISKYEAKHGEIALPQPAPKGPVQ